MRSMTVTQARSGLYRLLDDLDASSEPVRINGKRHSAILVSDADWRAVQETLYLLSVPGMRESIREGLETPFEDCSEDPGW